MSVATTTIAKPTSVTPTGVSFLTWVSTSVKAALRQANEVLLSAQEPSSIEELLERAKAYESTHPSYAADLRAAALYAQAEREATGVRN